MTPYLGFDSAGAEVRAASAIDIALWDLAGHRHGIPMHQALGGASRLEIRAYNTCAGYSYNTSGVKRRDIGADDKPAGPYDDQVAFMRDAGALAESLLSEGYSAVKIWPFDIYAPPPAGTPSRFLELKNRARAVPKNPRRGRRPHRGDVRAAQPVGAPTPPPASAARWKTTMCSRRKIRSARWTTWPASPTCAARPARRSAAARPWADCFRSANCWPRTPSTS